MKNQTDIAMRRNGYSRLWKLLPVAAVLLCTLAACTGTEEDIVRTGKGDAPVRFSLRLPGASAPRARALTEGDESIVKEIDVLVFKPGGGEYVYSAGCSGAAITGTGNTKTFTVTLRQGQYDLAILAGARDILNATDLTGKNKAAALAALTAAVPADGKWLTKASDTAFRPFAMWGDIGTITINESTDLTGSKAISLLRMMARVDVTVAAGNFRLTSVHVYNYNTKGSVAPQAANMEGGKAKYPTVPATSTLIKGPLLYDGSAIDAVGNQCVCEIYLMEAENHTDATHTKGKELLKRTCLVVGGRYDTDSKPTYYRVDFSTGKGVSQVFLDVLRNHKYTINITEVKGSGYEEPGIAFESLPVNMEAEVLEWNQAGMNIITTDGQYTLAVNRDTYTFGKREKLVKDNENTLRIWTDYSKGWKVEKYVDATDESQSAGWLSLTPESAVNSGDQPTETFIGVQKNGTGITRRAKIILAAGRLRKEIRVEQAAVPEFAWSNIVYKDGKLTFSTGPDDTSVDPRVQGVFFQWGSLVAVSPEGNDYGASRFIFSPSGTKYTSWKAVPYADNKSGTGTNDARFESSHGMKEDDFDGFGPGGKGFNATTNVGDICRYISARGWVEGNWRLPTGDELKVLANLKPSGGWTTAEGNPSGGLGSADQGWGGTSGKGYTINSQFFPAAGYRRTMDGVLISVGIYGSFWSGSSSSSSEGYRMDVHSSGTNLGSTYRETGYSVRCVRE